MNATATNSQLSTQNPFAALEGLQEKIVQEQGKPVRMWSRIPLSKKGLVEVSFNFVGHEALKGCSVASVVPDWVQWEPLYNPEMRNAQRAEDARDNDRSAHSNVAADRPGMILSANARLNTEKSMGRVRLGDSFMDDLRARGYRLIYVYAQWKKAVGIDAEIESRVRADIQFCCGERMEALYELERTDRRLERSILGVEERSSLEKRAGKIRAFLEKNDKDIARLQGHLPVQKGWLRVYFAHKDSDFYKDLEECRLADNLYRSFFETRVKSRQRRVESRRMAKQMEGDLKKLFSREWGRTVVWNNPSTVTNSISDDPARHPKVAIQLMNDPKRNHESVKLVLQDTYLVME